MGPRKLPRGPGVFVPPRHPGTVLDTSDLALDRGFPGWGIPGWGKLEQAWGRCSGAQPVILSS